jgi:hypothetical protein
MTIVSDTNRLKEFLHEKIEKRKKQIHPAHNLRFNHDRQLEIDCIEWALRKIEVNKIPNDRLDGLIRKMIKKRQGHEDQIPMTCGQRLKPFNGFCMLCLP